MSFPTLATAVDDDDESSENVIDYTMGIHDGVGPKNMDRRVSFAPQAYVR